MKKQTKLSEKATRIPDTRQTQWEELIDIYLKEIEPVHSESGRSFRFGVFIQQLLGFEPGFIEAYVSGIEKYIKVKQKDRILKGKADNLFGNVIIEFEANIPKKLSEAEEQLRRYTAILWSQEVPDKRIPYLCLATDGVRFVTYSPTLSKAITQDIAPEDVNLEIIEKTSWTKSSAEEIFYWLDRYFLRKEVLHPTSVFIVLDFGIKSHAFKVRQTRLCYCGKKLKPKAHLK